MSEASASKKRPSYAQLEARVAELEGWQQKTEGKLAFLYRQLTGHTPAPSASRVLRQSGKKQYQNDCGIPNHSRAPGKYGCPDCFEILVSRVGHEQACIQMEMPLPGSIEYRNNQRQARTTTVTRARPRSRRS